MGQEGRKTFQAATWGALVFLFIQLAHAPLNRWYGEWLSPVYLFCGIVIVAMGFAIFAQGMLLFSDRLSRQRLYISALFLGICIFDFVHIIGYLGLPVGDPLITRDESLWILGLSRLVGSIGILLIFRKRDEPVPVEFKNTTFTVFGIVTVLLVVAFAINRPMLPHLTDAGILSILSKSMSALTLLIYLVGIYAVARPDAKNGSCSRLIIVRSLVCFALGEACYIGASGLNDMDYLLGTVFGCAAYMLLLAGVFRLTVEEPFHEEVMSESRMNDLAYYDDLTGLPNRRRLTQRVEESIKESDKDRSKGFSALVIMNINHFKNINDSLGHLAGDRLIQKVAERISAGRRRNEELFSMGADEFAYLMTERSSLEGCLLRGKELLRLFEEPIELDSGEYHISFSLGLSIYPGDGESAEELIQSADMAVHNAKEQGVEIRRFKPSMQMKAKERLKIENDLRKALERGEFYLEYQPQVHLETSEVIGMEALLRWNHPKQGLISPAVFIPVAEESGLIVPIGEWVLRTACEQNKAWQEAGYRPMCISVNLSLRQFLQPNLAGKIGTILDNIGLDPKYVDLEITESMTLDKEVAFDQLQRLKQLGVCISIDDFGTGYSSLHYLKDMPIDRLKIDRSFIQEVLEDSNNAAIVSTITSMAHHLKLKVTAEGVESLEQLNFLRQQRCHEGQGYLFSKPIKANEFERVFLKNPLLWLSS